jgi:hypothetical protein
MFRTMKTFPKPLWILAAAFTWLAVVLPGGGPLQANPDVWRYEWPKTDFDKTSVDFDEIMSGGPPKDGIPAISNPEFLPVSEISDLGQDEPVIGLVVEGEAKAYPLRILTWHEIVNDEIAGVPVLITYCPLCNSTIVFDRRVGERVLEFGVSGKLRNSDMVMYDRNTESWWQQFIGEGIVGELVGVQLEMIPARLESWSRFAERHPEGKVLVPSNPGLRPYGANPYVGYDTARLPFLYRGEYPEGIEPMERVIAIGDQAWSLSLLQQSGRIETDDLVLRWEPGQNSALDTRDIAGGRDVGNVLAQRKTDGGLEDIAYDVTFAFVFHAFRPEGTINK